MNTKPLVWKIIGAALTIALIFCLGLCMANLANAASDVTFQWDANTEADLEGYRLYQSNQSGVYNFGPGNEVANIPAGTESVTLNGVLDGTWYWVLTAYDTNENESGPSNEVTASLDTEPPAPPEHFLITLIKKIIAWIINLFKNVKIA